MKKNKISGKALGIGGLCLVCVVILVGIWIWSAAPKSEFTPDPDDSVSTHTTWNDPGDAAKGDSGAPAANPGQADPNADSEVHAQDNYKVASESEDEVVINMTPPVSEPVETPPPAPSGQAIPENNAIPSAPADGGECIPSTPEKKPETKPGQVYDPVFGWTDLPSASGSEAHSDGDPNKMIGTMD